MFLCRLCGQLKQQKKHWVAESDFHKVAVKKKATPSVSTTQNDAKSDDVKIIDVKKADKTVVTGACRVTCIFLMVREV